MTGRASMARLAPLLAAAVLLASMLPPPAAAHGGQDVFVGDEAIYTVTWNPQGTRFAVGTATGNISIYDGLTHGTTPLFAWHAHDGPINEVAFAPGGSELVSASGAYKNTSAEATVKVWTLPSAGQPTLRLNLSGHYDWVPTVVWSPDGRFIASASGIDDHEDTAKAFGEVFVWDAVNGGEPLWKATPLDSYPARLAWSPDGRDIAAVGHLSDIWLLNATTHEKTRISPSYRDPPPLHAAHGWSIDWSPDSRYVVAGFSRDLYKQDGTAGQDGATDTGPVIVFDTLNLDASGLAPLVREAYKQTRPVEWVTWDSTGGWIASCSGADIVDANGNIGQDGVVDIGEVSIFNVTATPSLLTEVQTYRGGYGFCSSVDWRPGNLTVVAANADGTTRLYVLDEDGDGCLTWQDASPYDPTTCTVPEEVRPGLFDNLVPVLLVLGGVIAIVAGAALYVGSRRRERGQEEEEGRRGRRHRRPNGHRRRNGRRGARR